MRNENERRTNRDGGATRECEERKKWPQKEEGRDEEED